MENSYQKEILKLPRAIFEQLIAAAQRAAPNEGCGILAGNSDTISQFFEMENAAASPEFFELKPEEHFGVIKKLRTEKLEKLGIFHSHPTSPARPSAEDIKFAFDSETLYFILSMQNPDEPVLKAFQIVDGKVTEKDFKIVE